MKKRNCNSTRKKTKRENRIDCAETNSRFCGNFRGVENSCLSRWTSVTSQKTYLVEHAVKSLCYVFTVEVTADIGSVSVDRELLSLHGQEHELGNQLLRELLGTVSAHTKKMPEGMYTSSDRSIHVRNHAEFLKNAVSVHARVRKGDYCRNQRQ